MSAPSYQQTLVNELIHVLKQIEPFNSLASNAADSSSTTDTNQAEPHSALTYLNALEALANKVDRDEVYYEQGQDLMCHLVTHYPQATHLAHRDLFWHFAGECLHYLSDEEIASYQQMEELMYPMGKSQGLEREEARKIAFEPHIIKH